jgi:hypothetical protein
VLVVVLPIARTDVVPIIVIRGSVDLAIRDVLVVLSFPVVVSGIDTQSVGLVHEVILCIVVLGVLAGCTVCWNVMVIGVCLSANVIIDVPTQVVMTVHRVDHVVVVDLLVLALSYSLLLRLLVDGWIGFVVWCTSPDGRS